MALFTTIAKVKKLIDTHCHIYLPEFSEDLEQTVQRAVNAGVCHMLLPNVNCQTYADLIAVCDRWPELCTPMIGLHPEDLEPDFHAQLDWMKAILDQDRSGLKRIAGIGETGIDLHWDTTRLDDQIESFRTQIEWALEYDLPLIVHTRDAQQELWDVVKDYVGTPLKGIFHCFSGSADDVSRLLGLEGFMFGIGGTLTYKKSPLPGVLESIPLERIVLETDCPYLPPVPFRGKRNEPSFMVHTASFMAQLFNCPEEHIWNVTSHNALSLFGMEQ